MVGNHLDRFLSFRRLCFEGLGELKKGAEGCAGNMLSGHTRAASKSSESCTQLTTLFMPFKMILGTFALPDYRQCLELFKG